jgi:hypothetical protein
MLTKGYVTKRKKVKKKNKICLDQNGKVFLFVILYIKSIYI